MRVERFWNRLLELVQRHHPGLSSWAFTAHPEHLELRLETEQGPLVLRIAPDDERHWLRSASQTVTLREGRHEALQKLLRELVLRGDPGGLVWALPERPKPAPDAGEAPATDGPPKAPKRRLRDPIAEAELADALHWASFLAYKSTLSEDLYPHVNPLGQLIDTETLLGHWAKTAARIRAGTAPRLLGLYTHVPFCTVACSFCYCAKTDDFRRDHVQRYVDDLCAEAELFAPLVQGLEFTSAYFGGGTPSLLTPPQMRRLFETLWSSFFLPEGTQIIYEGNPDSLNDRKIEVLGTVGRVSRLTIGVQTLDDEVQKLVRRFNTHAHVREAVESARRWGIQHVNLDLMAGLPGQSLQSFLDDLEFLLSCEPDSIHLNAYRPLPRVRLARQRPEMDAEARALREEMMARAAERLVAHGHSAELGQVLRKTRNAANIQEYDLRRQNSSLLGLGVPSRAHAFGGAYYMPDFHRGFEVVREPAPLEARRWRAVPSDDLEEQHKYLVSNLQTGFTRSEFHGIFGCDVLDAHAEVMQNLSRLGVVEVDGDDVRTYWDHSADCMIYRGLLYSRAHDARAREVWGAEYQRDADYRGQIIKMIGAR